MLEALLDDESEALRRRVIGLAKMGDDVAMRLVFARMLPPRRDRPPAGRIVSACRSLLIHKVERVERPPTPNPFPPRCAWGEGNLESLARA